MTLHYVTMPPSPGTKPNIVADVFIQAGDSVRAGQELFSVETSKRAIAINAAVDGTVKRVLVAVGDRIAAEDVLAEIDEDATSAAEGESMGADEEPSATADDDHVGLLVIGGGVGGYVAAIYAAKMGLRVTLVERGELGGTCLNRGCIPTKTLISSASLHYRIAHASQWGIDLEGSARPNMAAIIERKERVVRGLREGVEELMRANRIHVLRGSARFEDAGTVAVSEGDGQRLLSFDDCIIASGSAIRPLELPGADLHEVMNTDEALDCPTLPSSIVIVGGGVTGMEFAFMYADLGVQVTVIARRERVLHLFDEDASTAVAQSAAERGILLELGGDVKGFDKQRDGRILTTFAARGSLQQVTSDRVLVAGGRAPVTDGLNLDGAGIACDKAKGAVLVDEHMRTNVEHVYAIGDVNGLAMLAHAASYQGRTAVDDIVGKPTAFNARVVPSVAYTDPEVATVGVGVDEARANQDRYSVGTFSFAHNGKALAENDARGYVSLVCDVDGKVQGATIVGGNADVLVNQVGMAVSAGLSGEDVRGAVFAHPTTAEALHEAACDLTFGALHE